MNYSHVPLIIDLDGTLLRTDSLYENLIGLLLRRPWSIWCLLCALLHGRAALKAKVESLSPTDASTLCYRKSILERITTAREAGEFVCLVTASDQSVADKVSAHLGCFDNAIGSDGLRNLKGNNKRDYLLATYPGGFRYAGDSSVDLPIWRVSKGAILVGNGERFAETLRREGVEPEIILDEPRNALKDWMRELRLHQWSKNALLFVPLLLGHVTDLALWGQAVVGFLAVGIVASATYIINDILDIGADRKHRSKYNRPLAAGRMQVLPALLATVAMLLGGFVVAFILSPRFLAVLLAYLALTLTYSLSLKRIALFDVAAIGALFTLRMIMGIAIGHLPASPWALSFSMFLFFSLALAKRHVEVMRARAEGTSNIVGRGYQIDDWPLTLALGVGSAMSAIVLLLLFIINGVGEYAHYTQPDWLYLSPLAVFLWVLRVWLFSHRMVLDDDPIVFAVKDKVSYVFGAVAVLGFALAF